MNYFFEKERKLPVKYEVDVLVAGSGPAGVGAAIAAGRAGVKTLLIEKSGSIGGMSTTGLMSHFTGTVDCKLYKEVLERQRIEENRDCAWHYINPEALQIAYIKMLREAGVEILLYTTIAGVICENNTVKGVIIESKNGREVVLAKRVIDGTGDGDVAAKAGVKYTLGREGDGKMQPATLMFKVGGVDYDRAVFPESFETLVDTEKGELQSLARKYLTAPMGHVLLYTTSTSGVVTLNMTNVVGVDGTKTEDLTRAKLESQLQTSEIVKFLRGYAPGYEKCYILETAELMGIRETRHFEGETTLTKEDIDTARIFDEWVVKGAYFNFDVHNLDGAGLDKTGAQKYFGQKNGYTIPYGCLLPKNIENLLLSGRNISGTHIAHSNFRAMPICLATGFAAGIAASLSVKNDIPLRSVPVAEIQKIYCE